jgi:hypothetical protein
LVVAARFIELSAALSEDGKGKQATSKARDGDCEHFLMLIYLG